MPRSQHPRGIKVCAQCGEGYDAFKAMEVRGRYCSPGCLQSARAAHRGGGHQAPRGDPLVILAH
jgi:hypothetical protein